MQTTRIITEGWTAAEHGFVAMLRHQLSAIEKTGRFALAGPTDERGDPSGAAEPEGCSAAVDALDRVVYRFGGPSNPALSDPDSRLVNFWPDGPDPAGEVGCEPIAGRGRIVVPSHWSRERVIATGYDPDCVVVVSPGVDGEAFSPLSRIDRETVRATLGIIDCETLFLHFCDRGDDAGTDLVLLAFARLRESGARVRLVMAKHDPNLGSDFDQLIHNTAVNDSRLLAADCLAAIVTVRGRLSQGDLRLLYGAADALVSPDRKCAFALPVIEAIACGCPVVVTRGGAADDICDDDTAWRISGPMRRDERGGDRIEPDLDELTGALEEIAQGRGFDRLGFAKARMQLLRDATWARSAQRLAEALNGSAPLDVATSRSPAVLQGLPQTMNTRFRAEQSLGLASRRRRATRRVVCKSSRDLSVVVQGPCIRKAVELGAPSIDETLVSIRDKFPDAQIVVSTWTGSDIDGLDADDIVLSPDPGSLVHPMHRPNNFNRMLTSTTNGIAAATRPFCIKTRNDLLFGSARILQCPLQPAALASGLERRIWAMVQRLETSLRPFHPSDMMMFGQTEDLRRLWSIPEVSWSDMFLSEPYGHIERMTSEQALFTGYLRSRGEQIAIENTFDGRFEVISASTLYMLASFDVFDEADIDLIMPRRFINGKMPHFCETHSQFESLRRDYEKHPHETVMAIYNNFHQRLNSLLSGKDLEMQS